MRTDVVAALVAFLAADADIATASGGRIFGAEVPEAEVSEMPRECVVIRPSGGVGTYGRAWQEYGDARYDVHCYGPTPEDAGDLWRAVHPALKNLTREVHAEVLLHWAREAGGPMSLRDRDLGWPYTFGAWQVLASEITTT